MHLCSTQPRRLLRFLYTFRGRTSTAICAQICPRPSALCAWFRIGFRPKRTCFHGAGLGGILKIGSNALVASRKSGELPDRGRDADGPGVQRHPPSVRPGVKAARTPTRNKFEKTWLTKSLIIRRKMSSLGRKRDAQNRTSKRAPITGSDAKTLWPVNDF